MSMRENPSSGYVVPLAKLKALLPENKQDEFDGMVLAFEEGDKSPEELEDWLNDQLPDAPGFTLYYPADEDTVDEQMSKGEWYAVFDEGDLYVLTPRPELLDMQKRGIDPQFSRWSVWG